VSEGGAPASLLLEHDLFGKPVPTFPGHALQCFPDILDHSVIPYVRKAPSILVLAHVLVGEPDPTSPGHALGNQPARRFGKIRIGLDRHGIAERLQLRIGNLMKPHPQLQNGHRQ